MTSEFWTEARVAYLTEKWAAGWSAGMIGKDLGCSLGCISGKVSRLKLPKRATAVAVHGWKSDPKTRRDRRPRAALVNTEKLNRSAPVHRGPSNFVNNQRKTKAELREELQQAVLNTGGRIK